MRSLVVFEYVSLGSALLWIAIMCVISSYTVSGNMMSAHTTYRHNDRECKLCPAGTHFLEHCNSRHQTGCRACPHLTFTSSYNKAGFCRHCTIYCQRLYEIKVQNCTSDHDIECRCKPGFYLKLKHDSHCYPHRFCDIGNGVKQTGTPISDVECEPCRVGYFSNVSSSVERCRKLTDCAALGLYVMFAGNVSHDSVCGHMDVEDYEATSTVPNDNSEGETVQEVNAVTLTVTLIVFGVAIILLAGLLVYRSRKSVSRLLSRLCSRQDNSLPFAINEQDEDQESDIPLLSSDSPQVIRKALSMPANLDMNRRSTLDDELNKLRQSVPTSNQNKITSQKTRQIRWRHSASCGKTELTPKTKLRHTKSADSASELFENKSEKSMFDAKINKPLFQRSNSNRVEPTCSPSALPPVKEAEGMTVEMFFHYIAKQVWIENGMWRHFLMYLPGVKDTRLTDNVVNQIQYDYEKDGLVYVIFKCLLVWRMKNPDCDAVSGVITALKNTNNENDTDLAKQAAEIVLQE